jgi:hypothetical protein
VPDEPEAADPEGPPPLPLRIAGRHAPAPPLARRRPRHDSAPSSSAPALAALVRREPEPEAPPPEATAPEPEPEPPAPVETLDRRSALAEFSALATSSGDDFIFRRR